MPKIKRPRREPTEDWQQLQLLCDSQPQLDYELIRPVVLFGQTLAERAQQTGKSISTINRKANAFAENSLPNFFAPGKPAGAGIEAASTPTNSAVGEAEVKAKGRLPQAIRDFIVELKAQYTAFGPHEIANICSIKFKTRSIDLRTVRRTLAHAVIPANPKRRFGLFAEIADKAERRLAIIRLHSEGWNLKTIASYLQTDRRTVQRIIKRWWQEGVSGLEDKPKAPQQKVRKVTLHAMEAVRELQENPNLGKYRMQAALQQLGIEISAATCGRIMARNRAMYTLPVVEKCKPAKQEMPFAAGHRHQYWSVDLRYLPKHGLPDNDYVYCITILDNYSRAIMASALCRRQDLKSYLVVLYAAIKLHGIPEALVSDSGSIFVAKQACAIYEALGIEKKQIAKRKPWQNYSETTFSIQHRMADYAFEKATTWEELLQVHERWVADYNYQSHWAHQQRTDDRHSPVRVLGWVKGKSHEDLDLERIFHSLREGRKFNKLGYVRFRHWQIYGEYGLAHRSAAIWLYQETLTVEFNAQPLSEYNFEYADDQRKLKTIKPSRIHETNYKSAQMRLWPNGEVEWLMVRNLPNYAPRQKSRANSFTQTAFAI